MNVALAGRRLLSRADQCPRIGCSANDLQHEYPQRNAKYAYLCAIRLNQQNNPPPFAQSSSPLRTNCPQLFLLPSVIYNVGTMAIDRDLELMLRVRQGDAESFDVLLDRHRKPLVGFFARMVRDQALAEDLAQEAFLRVYQARHRYQPEAKFTTWLYRIATNLALNALRDRKSVGAAHAGDGDPSEGTAPMEQLSDSRPTAEQELLLSERERTIRQAVESLPENQRAAVILHKYQDVDYRQIAGILGVSESAVKSLLFRAYENLRIRLEPLLRGGQI